MYVPARKFLILSVLLFPLCASGWLINENGPEPILVQVKQSIRLDPNLDAQLQDLAALETSLGMNVTKIWAGPDAYIQLLMFPADFTEDQAWSVADRLQQSPAVQQIAAASAFNLAFPTGEFGTEFGPNDTIPEAILRGLDTPAPPPVDPSVLNGEHVPNQLIVAWKLEFVWNAAQTGFLQTMADFNAAAECRVIDQSSYPPADLTQVLEFDPNKTSLLDELIHYTNSGFVRYAEPNFIYNTMFDGGTDPAATVIPTPRHSHRTHRKVRAEMDGARQRSSHEGPLR